jgi:hypothetical protein
MAQELSTSEIHSVKIVPYPKIIFFWPIFVTSLIIGVMLNLGILFDRTPDPEGETPVETTTSSTGGTEEVAPSISPKNRKIQGNPILGLIWIVVFAVNISVVAFEFSRIKFLATIMGALIFVLGAFLANTNFPFFAFLGRVIRSINIQANPTFYYMVSFIFLVIFGVVFISTRWNYWVVESNMILHYHGFMGDIHRYPAPQLRMSKEITDVFEYFLGSAGTLVLQPTNESRAIVLENVVGINRKEERIKKLLGSLQVTVKG